MNIRWLKGKFFHWIIGGTICTMLLVSIIFAFHVVNRDQIDWSMQAAVISLDGQIVETFSISVFGEIEKDPQERDTLRLNIRLPEDFNYMLPEEPTIFYSAAETVVSVPYYICGGTYCLERASGDTALVELALSEQQEFMILYFPETPDTFLVASTNHNVKPEEILTYFDFFVKQKTA